MGFTPWVPTIGSLPPPLSIANGGTGATTAAGGLAALGAMVNQASIALAGYTLINGTGAIISWTTPNDGALHQFTVNGMKDVTTLEAGGAIAVTWTAPDGTASGTGINLVGGAQAVGLHAPGPVSGFAQANTTVTVQQQTALTSGASKLWATIWGL